MVSLWLNILRSLVVMVSSRNRGRNHGGDGPAIRGEFSSPDVAPSPQWCQLLRYRWHWSCPDPGRSLGTNIWSCSCSSAVWGGPASVERTEKSGNRTDRRCVWPPQHAISIGTYKYLHLRVLTCPGGRAASSFIRCEAMGVLTWRCTGGTAGPVVA